MCVCVCSKQNESVYGISLQDSVEDSKDPHEDAITSIERRIVFCMCKQNESFVQVAFEFFLKYRVLAQE